MLIKCFSANGTWLSDCFNRSSVKLSTDRRWSSCAINVFTPADGGKRGSETPFVDFKFLFSHFTFCTSSRLKCLKALWWFSPQWRKWPVELTRLTGNKNKEFWQGDERICLQLSLQFTAESAWLTRTLTLEWVTLWGGAQHWVKLVQVFLSCCHSSPSLSVIR